MHAQLLRLFVTQAGAGQQQKTSMRGAITSSRIPKRRILQSTVQVRNWTISTAVPYSQWFSPELYSRPVVAMQVVRLFLDWQQATACSLLIQPETCNRAKHCGVADNFTSSSGQRTPCDSHTFVLVRTTSELTPLRGCRHLIEAEHMSTQHACPRAEKSTAQHGTVTAIKQHITYHARAGYGTHARASFTNACCLCVRSNSCSSAPLPIESPPKQIQTSLACSCLTFCSCTRFLA